jgi:glycosyltransferase involved in cell wall biosynthesis
MTICIIIPVFNEAPVISNFLKFKEFKKYNIVIIDDGSSDSPAFDRLDIPFTLLKHSINLGQGAALQTGMEYAKKIAAEIVVHFDSDGQHNADDIEKIIAPILAGTGDVVIGSRFLKSQKIPNNSKMPIVKKVVLQFAKLVQFVFTGVRLSDSQNGLRALSLRAVDSCTITENRMAHAIELIQMFKKNKLNIIEQPVTINYTEYSNKKGQKIINGFFIVIRLSLNKMIENIYETILILAITTFSLLYLLMLFKTATLCWITALICAICFWSLLAYKRSKKILMEKTMLVRKEALDNLKQFT